MDTLLPAKYVFNRQNVLTPKQTNLSYWQQLPAWSIYLIFALIILAGIGLFEFSKAKINNGDSRIAQCTGAILIFSTLIVAILWFSDIPKDLNLPATRPYQINCEFRFTKNSNIIVKQDFNKYPKSVNDKNGYPCQYFIADPKRKGQLIYLGQVKNGKLKLTNNAETSKIRTFKRRFAFYPPHDKDGIKMKWMIDNADNMQKMFTRYYNYVQVHHLANKFKNKLYLVKDPKITNTNNMPQYVLKGDGITLKIKTDKKQSYQIYAVKD